MGLKTTNYYVKSNGMFLPEAYAMIKSITSDGTMGRAKFIIQTSRANAEEVIKNKLKPIDEFTIYFDVDRNKNDREVAYNKAKSTTEYKKKDPITGLMVTDYIPNKLYGWVDDIWTI